MGNSEGLTESRATGSLSLDEIAIRTYAYLDDKQQGLDAWRAHLWKHRGDLFVIQRDSALSGICIAKMGWNGALFIDWIVCLDQLCFAEFIHRISEKFPGARTLVYKRHGRSKQLTLEKIQAYGQRLLKHK